MNLEFNPEKYPLDSLQNWNKRFIDILDFDVNLIVAKITSHSLASDPRRNAPFDLINLRSREGLLKDLRENDNLLYEWKNWAVCTTIWPYWNHHVMLIYTWKSQEICHIWQISNDEMDEYYYILNQLISRLKDNYRSRIDSWKLSLFYWFNHSFIPWPGKSQSVFRPHTHIVLIDNNEKNEENHKVERLDIHWVDINNWWKLALNRQNLMMIKDFEKIYSKIYWKQLIKSFFITLDEFYALDLPILWWIRESDFRVVLKELNAKWREYLEAIHSWNRQLVDPKVFLVLWDDVDKIWYSIWVYELNGVSYARIRFSFKKPWENAWVLEAMWHAINRDKDLWEILPNMDEIRRHVLEILWKR